VTGQKCTAIYSRRERKSKAVENPSVVSLALWNVNDHALWWCHTRMHALACTRSPYVLI